MEFSHELSTEFVLKLVSFLFWSSIYLYCSVNAPKKSAEWCSRVTTLLHGSVATLVGLSQCDIRNISQEKLTMKILPRHYALMVWSWGYFAFDLLWCLLSWSESALMLCHHVSAIIGINVYMSKSNTGCTFACTLAMLEVTNPLLQARWFLRDEGHSKTTIYYLVEVTYLVMFLSLRGIFGTWLIYKIIESDILDMDEKIMSLVLYIVSLGLIYDLIGFVRHKYKNKIEEVIKHFQLREIPLVE